MGRLPTRCSVWLVTCLLLLAQSIIPRTSSINVDYYGSEIDIVTTTGSETTSEMTTDIGNGNPSVVVVENVTPTASDQKHDNDQAESSSDDIIELNVGGQKITTLRSTLTAVPNSKLALLFAKGEAKANSKHFFDYNPVQFEYLLDQLRSIKRMPQMPAHELSLVAPHVDIRFNFSIMLYELGLNSDRFLSPQVGVHLNLTVKSLIGWKECFRGKYNTPFDGKVLTSTCKGKRLLVACRSTRDKDTLVVAGVGKREDIFFPCTPNHYCMTRKQNGTGFYYAQDQAWGFEGVPNVVEIHNPYNHYLYGGGQQNALLLNPCDASDQHAQYRLCWSLRSDVGRGGGDRCGSSKNLHNTKGWERLIYQTV